MAGTATMVVVWGNILSLIGNAFAQAVEILVFDAFFTRNEIRLYVEDASGNCVPVDILCFPIPKPMGPKILHRCNHLCCFILLQSLV